MTNEDQLHVATGRAARADALLRDELVQEAFKGLEAAYLGAWRATAIDDVAGREKLFLAVNIVGKVRDHLVRIIADGNLAQAELAEITKAAERKKEWHRIK